MSNMLRRQVEFAPNMLLKMIGRRRRPQQRATHSFERQTP